MSTINEGLSALAAREHGETFSAFEIGTHIKISSLEAENRRLHERLDALEARVNKLEKT